MSVDPYRYFRIEARELLEGLSRGSLELEKGRGGKELLGRLLRQAHTLKGASRVVKQSAIGDLAHAVEDVLGPFREDPGALPKERIDELLRLLDAIAGRVSMLDPAAAASPARPAVSAAEEPAEAVRVDLDEVDRLLEGLIEAGARAWGLARELEELEASLAPAAGLAAELARKGTRDPKLAAAAEALAASLGAAHRRLGGRLEELSRGLQEAREQAGRLRLLPAGSIFASLERAARDAAGSLGKRVDFQASGGETRLDAHVLGGLRAALLHVVRNAVAHGIEPEPVRAAAGKPPAGRVEVSVERRGGRIVFTCRDDGAGVDVKAVRRAAQRKGLLPAGAPEAMDAEEALRLLLRGGVTTAGNVDAVSGRGIGLDAVREVVARLKGEVRARTQAGRGTAFEIAVPVTLSSLPALLVEAGGVAAAVPLDSVPAVRRVAGSEVARSPEGDSVLEEGQGVPLAALAPLLGAEAPSRTSRGPSSVVLVRSGEGRAGLAVDRILGVSSVVVRPLPAWAAADPIVAGTALDAEGTPQVVLDPEALVRSARGGRAKAAEEPRPRPPVLVVDDSLTTRMLEQSILESSGYEVELANSGEEGLAKARRRKYGLFLVDVEMPGMDGFEFISRAKSDAALRDVPALLVTSRAADEDRRRGEEVGATAYIVKSEFDQGRLLEIIRSLIG